MTALRGGHRRLLDGRLRFAGAEAPSMCPENWPGYAIWRDTLYRNGEEVATVVAYWLDRDARAWYVEYRSPRGALAHLVTA